MNDPREPEFEVQGDGTARLGRKARDAAARARGRLQAFLHRHLRSGTRDWAVACHLAPVLAYAAPVPFLGAALAWAVWRLERDGEPGVATHGREALNFQLNVGLWSTVSLALLFVPWIAVNAVAIALSIMGALHAADGREWRYPLVFRIVD